MSDTDKIVRLESEVERLKNFIANQEKALERAKRSLHDYFMGQAIQAAEKQFEQPQGIARRAKQIADAVMRERIE